MIAKEYIEDSVLVSSLDVTLLMFGRDNGSCRAECRCRCPICPVMFISKIQNTKYIYLFMLVGHHYVFLVEYFMCMTRKERKKNYH